MTVHAPHRDRPHPNLGPRSARSSLKKYSKGISGSTSVVTCWPFTVNLTELIDLFSG
jgi:hypothetical protein